MNYHIKPVLLGFLWGVYEEVEVFINDCTWIEHRLRSLHLTKENAKKNLK
ncbi:hypothetical protein VPH5P1C_0172 [Vibrio phage 5P1c]|nr:hypothetical protein VP495E541_P0170 [Vibrio phage 495E54-1]CAH9014202.1 hypothetical protein VP496E541_P0170 [Vibrio phage 496E54-1]